MLVLLVAGKSSDSVDVSARNLKETSVVPLVLQAKNADPAELGQIVPSAAFVLTAESLPKIGDLQPEVVKFVNLVKNGVSTPGMA